MASLIVFRRFYPFSFLIALLIPLAAVAETHLVPGDFETIQAAVDISTPGDIVLITCDVYEETNIVLTQGITIRGDGNAADCVIIDAQQSGRCFYCNNLDQTIRIENITMRSGRAENGGAIYCNNSSLIFNNCTFEENSATNGGGIWCNDSSPSITKCIFEENTASGLGGGLYFQQDSAPTFSDCTFFNNTANSGGGLFCNTALEAEITDCTFSLNTGVNWGGGITSGNIAPAITNCTFFKNTGTEGSGIMVLRSGHLTLDHSIVGYGGGTGEAITCRGTATAILTCCDIYGNSGGNYVGCIGDQNGLDGNISTSPVFCDWHNYDLQLRVDSKCAPYSPPNTECGLIGAWPVGCNIPNPTFTITWSGIKSLYK